VLGIQYGSLTEDAYTGEKITGKGWKAFYFRKDFEGTSEERYRLAEGDVPDSVAASIGQRKRWAKGALQIFMKKDVDLVDPDWERPEVEVPGAWKGQPSEIMRKIFHINATLYPLGSLAAIAFEYVTLYFLFSQNAPMYLAGLRLLFGLVPKLFCQALLTALSNRSVENLDVVRSQETWFSYAFVFSSALVETIYWRITGKDPKWANTGALGRGSVEELPNVVVFFALITGVLYAVVIFIIRYDNRMPSHGEPNLFASLSMGSFVAMSLWPMVRMSMQEYMGWSYWSLHDRGNFAGNSVLWIAVTVITLWVYMENYKGSPPKDIEWNGDCWRCQADPSFPST